MSFDIDKKNHLKKIDKSKKQKIDKDIKALVKLINKKKNYFTTSSCSGRIVLLNKPSSGKKQLSRWLYSTHSEAKIKDVIKALKEHKKGETWFMMEPLILHVCCRTLEDASKLLTAAHSIGIKRAGIISAKKRFIVEVIGTEIIRTVIAKNKKVLIDEAYLKVLVDEANKKLKRTKQKIKKAYNKIIKI